MFFILIKMNLSSKVLKTILFFLILRKFVPPKIMTSQKWKKFRFTSLKIKYES